MSRAPEDLLPLTTVAFEILIAVAGDNRTGYEVMLAIDARTEGRLSPNPGTLYRAVDRLVGHGLLAVRELARDSGKERRELGLTSLGEEVLRAESERLAAQVAAAREIARERSP